jgi:hypothetical protein
MDATDLIWSGLSRNSCSTRFQNASIFYPRVLYGCETWSLTLREEHRLRVLENRVLRRIFGPERSQPVFFTEYC